MGLNLFARFRSSRGTSLRVFIAAAYSILAAANLLFFLVMVFENQTDLLLQLFRLQSQSIVRGVADAMKDSSGNDEELIQSIVQVTGLEQVNTAALIDENGAPLVKPDEKAAARLVALKDRIAEQIIEIKRSGALQESGYTIALDESDFSAQFLLSVPDGSRLRFAFMEIDLESFRDRLTGIYWQAGVAAGWVVLFHVAFGFFVFQILLKRIALLRDASHSLAGGNLDTRVDWNTRRSDELDELGLSFNKMAESLQNQMVKIQTLNNQIQKELVIGKFVQKMIVNDRENFSDYNPFIHYLPLREVSGDVYKFYRYSDHLRGIFLGDACGHGVSAALITSLAVTAVDRFVESEQHPVRVISKLAGYLNQTLEGMYYTTAIMMLFDEKREKLYVCNAGHPPPILLRPSTGKVNQIDPLGPPAGVIEEFPYSLQAGKVRSGDRVILYSDGIIEAMNAEKDIYTFERLLELIQENATLTTSELGERILEDVHSFTSGFHDDVTLIVLEIP